MRIKEYWTLADVRERFDDLLKSVDEHGPQEIMHLGRAYVLHAKDSGKKPSAKSKITKGGPLADEDAREAFD